MPQWIVAGLDVASWPARYVAERGGFDQTGWAYFLGVFALYVFGIFLAAASWSGLWGLAARLLRRVGKWSVRSGSIRSMKSVERSIAKFERAHDKFASAFALTGFYREELGYGSVPRDGARWWARAGRLLTRGTILMPGKLVAFARLFARLLVRPWMLLILIATIATVFPDAIPAFLAAIGEFFDSPGWTDQSVANIVAFLGVLIAIGVVVLKGFLSDRILARRQLQEERNREALASIVPLTEPLAQIAYYGTIELESACERIGWQLHVARLWINRAVDHEQVMHGDRDHLACDVNCPRRNELGAQRSGGFTSVELTKAFETTDQICGDRNPLDEWRTELDRLGSYRERSVFSRMRSGDRSLGELLKDRLSFLADGGVERTRIAWQHGTPDWLLDDDLGLSNEIVGEGRIRRLGQLADSYRRQVWDMLSCLRLCEEMAEIAWHANGARGDLFAKIGK